MARYKLKAEAGFTMICPSSLRLTHPLSIRLLDPMSMIRIMALLVFRQQACVCLTRYIYLHASRLNRLSITMRNGPIQCAKTNNSIIVTMKLKADILGMAMSGVLIAQS